MVGRKPVPSLRACSLRCIPRMVKENIVRAAHGTQCSWFRIFRGDLDSSSEDVLNTQIVRFKEYILQHVIWTDREEVFLLLMKGLDEGFQQIRNGWSPSKNHSQYSNVLEAVSMFTEVLAWPSLKYLDFCDVPRSMRSRMLNLIPRLTGLQVLIIGPGRSGGWVPIKGLAALDLSGKLTALKKLTWFSMKRDCTRDILSSVVLNSGQTIKIIDVENSKGITDESVPVLLECKGIHELNIYGTKIEDEGRARIIMGLPKLRNLVRADFLCDALGWIDYLDEIEDPVYEIRDFMPSQDYFFHETWQLEIVTRMCPKIEKMLFIHHPEMCPSLLPISELKHLTDLQLHGGDWKESDMDKLLHRIGPGLIHLGLISVKGLNFQTLTELFKSCRSLQAVVFNNCDFSESLSGMNQCKRNENLKELVVISNLRTEYITWMFRSAPNLEIIHLGYATHVKDSTFLQTLAEGHLEKLQEVQVERSADLSLLTVEALLSGCPLLRSLGDLGAWSGITGPELGQIRQICFEQNLDLDLSSHQVLRRFLGMAGEERQSMLNLMTGPVLERIRLAQAAARNNQEQQRD